MLKNKSLYSLLVLILFFQVSCSVNNSRAKQGNLINIMELINSGYDINAKDFYGNTLLISATYHNNLDALNYLLEKGADTGVRNNQGYSALLMAAYYGQAEIAELLIKHGANINDQIDTGKNCQRYYCNGLHGFTALHFATYYEHYHLLEVLLDNDADTYIVDAKGNTALFYANLYENVGISSYIQENQRNRQISSSATESKLLAEKAIQKSNYEFQEADPKNMTTSGKNRSDPAGSLSVLTYDEQREESSNVDNNSKESKRANFVELSGPRIGFSYMPDNMVEEIKKDNNSSSELTNFMTQFGWQFEKKLITMENGISFLFDLVPLIGGLDHNMIIPSLTGVFGVRTLGGYEFHVGPNATPSGTTIVYVVGKSFVYGNVNIPINLAVFPTKYGYRFSFLTGVNW